MTDAFQYRGLWWLPHDPETTVSGTLTYTPGDGVVLDVIGSLVGTEEMREMRGPPVILGTSSNGKDISLHGCLPVQMQTSHAGVTTSSYLAEVAFVGVHFENAEDVSFRSMNVRFSHFDEWANMSGFTVERSEEGDQIIRYRRPHDIRVRVADDCAIIITTIATFPLLLLENRAAIEQQTIARIEATRETSLEGYRTVIRRLQDFLSLAAREPVCVLRIEAETEANRMLEPAYYPPVGVFYRSSHVPQARQPLRGWHMLFTYEDISGDLEVLLRNWFEKADQLEPVWGLYFATLDNPHLYLEHHFLSLVQAAEALHERIRGGRYMADSDYKATVYAPLVGAIPDVNQGLRDNLEARLRYGNRYSLKSRLSELVKEYGGIVPQLLPNRAAFVKNVADTRDYLTHYDERLRKRCASGTDLLALTKRLRVLVEVCLVRQTGLDSQRARGLFARHRAIREEAFWSPPIAGRKTHA